MGGREILIKGEDVKQGGWLTGDDPTGEGGQEAYADHHYGDDSPPAVSLQHDQHEQAHGAVHEEWGEETPEEHPVPHLWQGGGET